MLGLHLIHVCRRGPWRVLPNGIRFKAWSTSISLPGRDYETMFHEVIICYIMMSSSGNFFRVTGLLCGKFSGRRWIPHTKAEFLHAYGPPTVPLWRQVAIVWLKFGWKQIHDSPLQWRHNEREGVSNHQPNDCLFKRLFRRWWKKASKLRVTGLCVGNSPVTGEFPTQRVSNAENVSILWRHHASTHDKLCRLQLGRLGT